MPIGVYKRTEAGIRNMSLSRMGKKFSPETRKKMSEAKLGDKAYQWLSDDKVTYTAVHKWVYKHLGKPKYCAYCQRTDKKVYHWANISHAYKRDLSDWIRLCVKCHSAYDWGKISLTPCK